MSRAHRGTLPAAVLLALLTAVWPAPAAAKDSCVECHSMFKDEPRISAPIAGFAKDIHAKLGFTCVSCHGGDPSRDDVDAMDPAKGFRALKRRGDVAEMCARCHADAAFMKRYNPRPYIFSVDEYRTSVHCKREAEGDQKVATCTNCHGVHGILSVKDPASPVYPSNVPKTCAHCHNAEYMKGRTVRTDQFALYSKSVHGIALLEKGDVSAPACNDCHGNHGAAPPGVGQVTMVCGTCHGREAELFEKSAMKLAMDRQGKPGCVSCHSNHGIQHPTDAMLASGRDGLCSRCHVAGSRGDRLTAGLLARFAALRHQVTRGDSLLHLAELRGMETSAGRAAWKEAQDQVVSLRATVHSFDAEAIGAGLTQGAELAGRADSYGAAALADWRSRRLGMASSLGVILLLIAILVLKIRQMES